VAVAYPNLVTSPNVQGIWAFVWANEWFSTTNTNTLVTTPGSAVGLLPGTDGETDGAGVAGREPALDDVPAAVHPVRSARSTQARAATRWSIPNGRTSAESARQRVWHPSTDSNEALDLVGCVLNTHTRPV
jgi:hypothetical protein